MARGMGIGAVLRRCKLVSKQWVLRRGEKSSDLIRDLENKCSEIEDKIAFGSQEQSLRANLNENRRRLWEAVRREEREWIQKSRLKWAVAGDRNTKFFQLAASARRRSNFIGSIKVGKVTYDKPVQVKQAIEMHFRKIFNSSNTIPIKMFDCDFNKIDLNAATVLEKPFSEDEIFAALSTVESSKSPGPDGFNMGFLKKFWPTLKFEILEFFCRFFEGDTPDRFLNHSFVVLIPKIQNPVLIEDYRPISLVGCVYKLLAKVLARRLGAVLDEIIGEQQFAFCPGRQILDCSLIANDYNRRKGLEGVVIKVDFYKAYDTVDWGFLIAVMKKMGFGSVWCKWMFTCISKASISVLVNGSPTSPFNIRRGLRQGCPLSPMLFNIVAEALSVLLNKATSRGLFNGIKIGQNAFEVSHIQFADDLILFCGAGESQIRNVVRILRGFELAAGLKLNLKKTKLIGINIDKDKIDYWASLIHCQTENLPCQYLGLPLGASRNSIQLWSPVVEKFKKKLSA
ncbi:hypothetical protein GQ457_17G003840 [Hibiscus cannabinus]